MINPEWTGAEAGPDGIMYCSQCDGTRFGGVMFADSPKHYTQHMECEDCGSKITMTAERTWEETQAWEG